MKIFTIFILLTTWVTNFGVSEGYNILMVTLLPSKSHHKLCTPIVDLLAARGHKVTLISPYPRDNSPCKEIAVPELDRLKENNPLLSFEESKLTLLESFQIFLDWNINVSKAFMENKDVRAFLDDKSQKFDLMLTECFGSEFLFGLSVRYDCPVITLSSINMQNTVAKMIGNPYSIATVPHMYLEATHKMNFLDRTKNFLLNAVFEVINNYMGDTSQKALYERHFPEESKLVPYEKAIERLALVFTNTHPSIGTPRPLLPNVVEIGGYHIDDPKPLPRDLQKAMDSAEHGVIYFSLGSIVDPVKMDPAIKKAFVKVFSRRKETVLWKFEENVPGMSQNVVIRRWMPQTAILAHPNIRLFITHGGLLSCTEATRFGVPMVLVPVFGDQKQNAFMFAGRGQGAVLNLDNITQSSLEWAIDEVLGNPDYSTSSRRVRDLFLDRPSQPRDLIAYYAEHVARTRGAAHLSPPRLSRCELLLLDVLAVLVVPLVVVAWIVVVALRRLCCKRKGESNSDGKKKEKKGSGKRKEE